jgi:putative inorganic carbon (HCO3(-)) transporter
MIELRKNIGVIAFGLIYTLLCGYLVWQHQEYFALASIGLILVYCGLFYTEISFLSLGLLAPLSVNIEEYVDGFGLFLPTEPLLFGLLVIVILLQLRRPFIPQYVWKNPIVQFALIYCLWLFLTSITSSNPLASFKFLLARLWFLGPLLLLGPVIFAKKNNVQIFLWLFLTGMSIACLYTLIHHLQFNFGEKEGHWVMWPFFKDHTIYGAIVAIAFVLSVGLYMSKKFTPLVQALILLYILIIGLGLYFSYTRAAWLSVIGAAAIGVAIKLKIRFSYILGTALFLGTTLFFTWDQIQMELARNKSEHTTENFAEKLQSATNVTTDASNLERLNRWSCAWEMFLDRPVMGFGPGTYAFEYARFQHPDNLTIISTNFSDGGNAHSEYLGPLSETGLPGLLIVLGLISAVFYKGITLYIKIPDTEKEMKTLVFYMILALSTYFIHGFLNNYLDTDKASVPIWGMAAMFIALEHRYSTKKTI